MIRFAPDARNGENLDARPALARTAVWGGSDPQKEEPVNGGKMLHRAWWVLLLAIGLVGIGLSATAQPEHATVCHHTGSSVNPFVTIHPSVNGAHNGHLRHPDDVIPPFEYQGDTFSLNWPSNEVDVVDGECVLIPSEEEPEEPPEVEPGPPVENEPPFTG